MLCAFLRMSIEKVFDFRDFVVKTSILTIDVHFHGFWYTVKNGSWYYIFENFVAIISSKVWKKGAGMLLEL